MRSNASNPARHGRAASCVRDRGCARCTPATALLAARWTEQGSVRKLNRLFLTGEKPLGTFRPLQRVRIGGGHHIPHHDPESGQFCRQQQRPAFRPEQQRSARVAFAVILHALATCVGVDRPWRSAGRARIRHPDSFARTPNQPRPARHRPASVEAWLSAKAACSKMNSATTVASGERPVADGPADAGAHDESQPQHQRS